MTIMPSWSRCGRDVGKHWTLLTSNNTARPLLTSARFLLPTYIRNDFLVMKPTILERYRLPYEYWDVYGRCVKPAGTVIDVSREGKSISVAREFMFRSLENRGA